MDDSELLLLHWRIVDGYSEIAPLFIADVQPVFALNTQ